jgi:hypothetical protein
MSTQDKKSLNYAQLYSLKITFVTKKNTMHEKRA